ncbi:hypothetical protein DRJ24_02170 [Candidatus Acetothermia bacterium]|nr:MAG: hypothetical protein DRJ24_02170 [Candidatus Acetothermia bacterium]
MTNRMRNLVGSTVVAILIIGLGFGGLAQKIAVFVQAAAPVPATDLEFLKNYANQRCAMITGGEIATQGELMYAQRLTNTYVGDSITVEGLRRLAQTLGVDHIVNLRIIRWEERISYKPERSLLLLGATSFLDASLQLLISPLGLLFGIDKEATVALFTTVFNPNGDIEFTTTTTCEDRPLLSLLIADPLEAARGAIDSALYQLAVAL